MYRIVELIRQETGQVHNNSLLFASAGLFLRHMILAYNKLSFSQVYKLYTALQQYFQNEAKKGRGDESEMELTRGGEPDEEMEKEELDGPFRLLFIHF